MTPDTHKKHPNSGSFGNSVDTLRENVGDAVDRAKSDLSTSAGAAREAFGEDLTKLKADLAQLQKTVSTFASEATGSAASAVKSVGKTVASEVGTVASEAAAVAGEAASTAANQAKTFASELESMARRNPLGTLAGMLVVGVVVGMMTRNRS